VGGWVRTNMASVSPAMFEAGRSLRRAQGPTGLCRCPGNSSLRRRRDPSRSRFASPSAAGGSRSRGTGRLSAKGLRRVVCGAVEDSYTLELTEENVENVLDEVRPYLMADGGNVELVEIDGLTVRVRLQGACGSCPSSMTTMKMGIQRKLMEKIPVSLLVGHDFSSCLLELLFLTRQGASAPLSSRRSSRRFSRWSSLWTRSRAWS